MPDGANPEQYTQVDYVGDDAGEIRRMANRMGEDISLDDLRTQIAQGQREFLDDAVRYGNDRAIGNTPNWDGMSSEALNVAATSGNSPGTADALGRGFNDAGNELATSANQLGEALTTINAVWDGQASGAAAVTLIKLSGDTGSAGRAAQLMSTAMAEQADAASQMRGAMPPAKDFDTSRALEAAMLGGPLALQQDIKAQRDEAEAVRKEQVRVMNAYTQQMIAIDAKTPTFLPPDTGTGSTGTGSTGLPGSAGYTGLSGNGVGYNGTFVPGSTTGGPTGGVHLPGGPGGPGTGYVPGSTGGQGTGVGATGVSGWTPGATGVNVPGTGGLPGTGGVPGGGGTGGGFGTGLGVAGMGAGGLAGVGDRDEERRGSGGPFGRGVPQPGDAGRGVPQTGMRAPTGLPAGIGPDADLHRPGMGALGPLGPGGKRPGAPGGVAPGARADDEEDLEHETPSYLQEADPEALFGTDRMTAPPVIGE